MIAKYIRLLESWNIDNWSINLKYVGHQSTQPGFDAGVHVVEEDNNYILHYILDGRGEFRFADKTVKLCAGDMFMLFPREVYYYTADDEEPWEYISMRFVTNDNCEILKQLPFSKEKPYFSPGKDLTPYIENIVTHSSSELSERMMRVGAFYEFLAQIVENKDGNNEHFVRAVEYILANYSEKITVGELAEKVGISRDWLFKIFQTNAGMSPSRFIATTRLYEAKKLLANGCSVAETSDKTGFCDQYHFSAAFKKYYGMSPSQYKKGITRE